MGPLDRRDKQVQEEFEAEVERVHRRQSTREQQSREDSKEGWALRYRQNMWTRAHGPTKPLQGSDYNGHLF